MVLSSLDCHQGWICL